MTAPDPSGGRDAPVVRRAQRADEAVAAQLHAAQIAEGFLSFLGPSFLRRLYHRIDRSPTSFLLVADDGGAVIGFVAGSTDVAGLYRSFAWRDGLTAALPVAGRLLRSWRRVLETVRHPSSGAAQRGRGAELLAIAVGPGHQGRGVGRMLVTAFFDEVDRRGLQAAYVVVGADNERAVGLYEQAGFVAAARFELHAGTTSSLLQWDRPAGPPPA